LHPAFRFRDNPIWREICRAKAWHLGGSFFQQGVVRLKDDNRPLRERYSTPCTGPQANPLPAACGT
jgi:hypothetical protein